MADSIQVSFDVFDTVLTRAVGDPHALPLLLGRRLRAQGVVDVSPEVFAHQRAHAERRAKRDGGGDPRLEKICAELAAALGDDVDPARLAQEEIALERRLSRVVPEGRALVERARPGRVAFLSDTTLPTEAVVGLLEQAGLWREGDLCLCSSDAGASKADGTLFLQAAAGLGSAPATVIHHGDHARSDVRNGRLSGWGVRHLPGASLNRYERILEAQRDATGGLSSAMAGASRMARLSHPGTGARERGLSTVAAGVMAPTLTAWLLWIIRRAQHEGCSRIYYMSRDGQVLVDLARRLEAKLRTGIEHRYLYGGRQASTSLRSLDASFSLHDLTDEEVAELLPEPLRDRASWDRLMYGDQPELRRHLSSERAQELLAAGTERARQRLIAYLRQEGWNSEGHYALVDVGWRGRIPAALAATIADTDLKMPDLLLYFGLERDARERMPPELTSHLQAWFFDRSRDEGYVRRVPGLQLLIEMFCVADHAPVTGYADTPDGRVEPIIDGAFEEAVAWGLPRVRRVVEAFADALVLDEDLVDARTDMRPVVDELLRTFWLDPTQEEVAAWGSFPVASDEVHTDHYGIAKPVTAGWLAQAARTRVSKLRAGGGDPGVGHIWYWPAGVLANSAPAYKASYKALSLVRSELPRARRRADWLRRRLAARTGSS